MRQRALAILASIAIAAIAACAHANDSGKSYDALMGSAIELEKKGEVSLALAMYIKASKAAPGKAEPLARASFLYLILKEPARAAEFARRAVELEPGHTGAWINLSAIELARGNIEEARKAAESGLSVEPENIRLLNNRATALLYQGRLLDSKETLMKVLSLDPGNSTASYNLACVYLRLADDENALKSLAEAIGKNPALKAKAKDDPDLMELRQNPEFIRLTGP